MINIMLKTCYFLSCLSCISLFILFCKKTNTFCASFLYNRKVRRKVIYQKKMVYITKHMYGNIVSIN